MKRRNQGNCLSKILFTISFIYLVHFNSFAQSQMTVDALKDSISKIMAEEHIPGIFLTMVTPDSVIWEGGIGLADVEDKVPVDKNTLFRIGSITKSFTSLAIQRLIDEGKFSLQSELKQLAPEVPFTNAWENEEPVRVVNLLEHTAGFDDMHFKSFVNLNNEKLPALEEVKAHKEALYSRWKPGTRSSYSNPGYAILGYLIEKYSGIPYEDYISQTVIKPIGMTQTLFNYELKKGYAKGYSYHNGKYIFAGTYRIVGEGEGSISSCASDMGKYVRFYLNEGRIDSTQFFSASIIHEMEHSHSTLSSKAGLTSGYGLANYTKLIGKEVKENFRGHTGGMMGFTSDFSYSRALGVGFALSNNGEAGNKKLREIITAFLLQGKSSPLSKANPLDQEKLKPWEGVYQLNSSRNQILSFADKIFSTRSVFIENDTLYSQAFLNKKEAILPVMDMQFRKSNEPIATMIFLKDGDLPVFFQNDEYLKKVSSFYLWSLRIAILTPLLCGLLLIPFSLAWLVMWRLKKLTGKNFLVRLIYLLPFTSLATMLFSFIDLTDLRNLVFASSINERTLTIFLSSLFLPLLSLLTLYLSVSKFRHTRSKFVAYFLLISTLGFCFISIYLFQYGWIGLRIWAY